MLATNVSLARMAAEQVALLACHLCLAIRHLTNYDLRFGLGWEITFFLLGQAVERDDAVCAHQTLGDLRGGRVGSDD